MTQQRSRLRRLAGLGSKFLVIGGISTAIEVAVFNLCVYGFGLDLVAAKIVASLVALVNAYIGNRQWVFRSQAGRGRWPELVLFVAVNVACLLLGAAIIWAGAQGFTLIFERGPGPFAVNLINLASIGVVVVVRFILYHKVVFRPARQLRPGPSRST